MMIVALSYIFVPLYVYTHKNVYIYIFICVGQDTDLFDGKYFNQPNQEEIIYYIHICSKTIYTCFALWFWFWVRYEIVGADSNIYT